MEEDNQLGFEFPGLGRRKIEAKPESDPGARQPRYSGNYCASRALGVRFALPEKVFAYGVMIVKNS